MLEENFVLGPQTPLDNGQAFPAMLHSPLVHDKVQLEHEGAELGVTSPDRINRRAAGDLNARRGDDQKTTLQ